VIEHKGAHKRRPPCCKDEAIRYLSLTLSGEIMLGGEFLKVYNNGYRAGFNDGKQDLDEIVKAAYYAIPKAPCDDNDSQEILRNLLIGLGYTNA